MQKRISILVISLMALVSLSLLTVRAQETIVNLLAGESAQIVCEGRTLIFTRLSRTEAKADCQDAQPDPTDTPEPDPTDTPEPDPTDPPPASGVPLCEDHDPTVWHGLYNEEQECHYDHTHNGNPHSVDHIFGPVGEWHNGQSISYPWHTPNENEIKHQGYKWEAMEIDDCLHTIPSDFTTCVTAWRIQFHVVGGPIGATTRIHSYSAEVRICTIDGSQCGTMRTGGWVDFGILEVPYKGEHIPLPGDPPAPPGGFNIHLAPYRGHSPLDAHEPGRPVPVTWTSFNRYGFNEIVEFDFKSMDDWQGIDPDDPGRIALLCPDFQCEFNHSRMGIYRIAVKDKLPTDENGLVNFNGYADRQGNVVDDCTEIGLDCVPLIFENVPVGRATMRVHPNEAPIEYDTSPAGEWWIEYPN